MANILSISPNQTTFLPSLCLVSVGLFCHSCFNLCSFFRRLSTYTLLDFKISKWAVSSLTHSLNPFQINTVHNHNTSSVSTHYQRHYTRCVCLGGGLEISRLVTQHADNFAKSLSIIKNKKCHDFAHIIKCHIVPHV